MDNVRWGMIGTGDVTEMKSGPAFNKAGHSSLVAVMNRTREKAESYAARHRIPRVHSSAVDLISDPDVDAVYIATPPSSHSEYGIMAMKSGKPVYVEKPMAHTWAACREMLDVAEMTGTPLFVAYYRRSMDYFLKVKELLEDRKIGRPFMCTSRLYSPPLNQDLEPEKLPWRVLPEISGGGYFHDMGCHELDILRFLFGEVRSVNGAGINSAGLYVPEDTIVACMEFESGLTYSGAWCFVAPQGQEADEIEILGERGSIRFSCFSYNPVRVQTGDGLEEFSIPPPGHVQLPMIRDVVSELRGQGRSPSPGISGAETSRIMEMILGKLA